MTVVNYILINMTKLKGLKDVSGNLLQIFDSKGDKCQILYVKNFMSIFLQK